MINTGETAMKSREQFAQEIYDGDVANPDEPVAEKMRRIRAVLGDLPDEEQRAIFALLEDMHMKRARDAQEKVAGLRAAQETLDGSKPQSTTGGDKTK
jgi:hypothetical protein